MALDDDVCDAPFICVYVYALEVDENGFTIDSSWGALTRNQVLLILSLPTSPLKSLLSLLFCFSLGDETCL